MTEPVAYIRKTSGGTYISQTPIGDNYGSKTDKTLPLYTAEQLHPRVKMTKAEFDEWQFLYEDTVELSLTAYRVLNEILNSTHNISGKYVELSKRVYQCDDSMSVSKNQAELANLFINYSPDKPEETIEIVPDMKWFVRSINKAKNGKYLWLTDAYYLDIPQFMFTNDEQLSAMKFDTKEEAEKWTNPLTEAVHLPVEGE